MTAASGGRPWPARPSCAEDDIIYAEQLAGIHEELAALREQRRHVSRALRALALRPRFALTTDERAEVTRQVSAALATRRAVAEAWGYWWSAYRHLRRSRS